MKTKRENSAYATSCLIENATKTYIDMVFHQSGHLFCLYPFQVVGDTSKHSEVIRDTHVISPTDYTSRDPLATFFTNKRSSTISLKGQKIFDNLNVERRNFILKAIGRKRKLRQIIFQCDVEGRNFIPKAIGRKRKL